MKIGIIGSGVVGQTLGTKWIALGHDVAIGTRDPEKIDDKKMMGESLREWRTKTENSRPDRHLSRGGGQR